MVSITQRGIEDPLEGVDQPPWRILLNGFKRCRSAQKLGIASVPYVSLGPEEATAILNLMRASTDKALGILEQARFLTDLLTVHGLRVTEVADTLGRSKAWVSMRRSLLAEMSPAIQELLFRGAFPVYSYMYTLRTFRRMNGVTQDQVERFMKAVAGQRLSVRDIERLARAYFQGPASLREAIEAGKLSWPLEQMRRVPDDLEGCSEVERALLQDLQLADKYLRRVVTKCQDARFGTRSEKGSRCSMIDADVRKAIYQLHLAGTPLHDISRQFRVSRNSVRRIIREQGVKLAEQTVRVVASLLYLRYSKRRYLKFYRVFNRFAMKCFFHEALLYWEHAAALCIIDNTNLARLRGSGKRAVIVPEMVSFTERYGFRFRCHELGHCNRKAGEERSFWTVETNFLPGRSFESLEDLNRQALEWATVRMHHRPVRKTGLIPAQAFEHERRYLVPLSPHLPAPYCVHGRGTDEYGYVSFEGNYYWIPGSQREDVKVLEYADHLELYQHRVCVAQYPLPADGVKNARFSPEGQPAPRHQPRRHRQGSELEEKRLRALGPEVAAYVDYVLATPGIMQRHRVLRGLLTLSLQVPPAVFAQTLARAQRYRVVELATVERIAWLYLSQGEHVPEVEVDESYCQRPAYLEGEWTDEPDLSRYDQVGDEEDQPEKPAREDERG